MAAMTDVAASRGYSGASVARVLERAEISRQTFYRHFSDREDCFLAAYREQASRMVAALAISVERGGPAERAARVLRALLRFAAADPAAAKLVLIEALGASPAIRAEHERLIASVQRRAERFLATPGALRPALLVPPVSLLGGVTGVVVNDLMQGQGPDLPGRADDLFAWVGSYAGEGDRPIDWKSLGRGFSLASGRPAPAGRLPLLPRGRNALPPESAAAVRRERILAATIEGVGAKGYADLTVGDVVAAARVPRTAFYAHFRCKQEAYIAAQTVSLQRSIAVAAREFSVGTDWPERVWRGLAALLDYLARHPAEACLAVAEVYAAGEAAVRRELENRAALTIFLEEGYRRAGGQRPLPALYSTAIAAAIYAPVREYVVAGRAARLLELLPQCAFVCLAPFLGPPAALELVQLRVRAAG